MGALLLARALAALLTVAVAAAALREWIPRLDKMDDPDPRAAEADRRLREGRRRPPAARTNNSNNPNN